jgi:adenylate kinase
MVDVPREECLRRAKGRKIDPTTGNIYHVEDNPPPEGDIKLRDRLQEYNDTESDP